MYFSMFQAILTWAMTMLLLANSVVILINIFDFPSSGLRHLVSFIAAVGLIFVTTVLMRYFNYTKRP